MHKMSNYSKNTNVYVLKYKVYEISLNMYQPLYINNYIPVFSGVGTACNQALCSKQINSGHIHLQTTSVVVTLVPSSGTHSSLHSNTVNTTEVGQT